MSSFLCDAGVCTFTRVDTNDYALGMYPPELPVPYFDDDLYLNETANGFPWDDAFNNAGEDTTTAPYTDKENQDCISETVCITRDFKGTLFNALVPDDQWGYMTPAGTEWALLPEGKTFEQARCELHFCGFQDCFQQWGTDFVGKPGILHLIQEDLYYNVKFLSWTPDDYYYYGDGFHRRTQVQPQQRTAEKSTRAEVDTSSKRSASTKSETKGPLSNGGLRASAQDHQQHHRRMQDEEEQLVSEIDSTVISPIFSGGGGGGGFSYERDEIGFKLEDDLPECPVCDSAKATPSTLTGPIDDSFVEVAITGVTPLDATITIIAVTQDTHPACNVPAAAGSPEGTVSPNAKDLTDTVMLRRTRVLGELNPFRYQVFFTATSEAGTCRGQVQVCVPPIDGLGCDSWYSFDATATSYCMHGAVY